MRLRRDEERARGERRLGRPLVDELVQRGGQRRLRDQRRAETLLSPNAEDSSTDAEGGEELPHKCSNLQATANTVNLLLGMGSLSLPFAVRSAGWLPGLGLLLSVSLLSAFAARTLWRTLLHLDAAGIPSRTYVDVAEAALGRAGGVLVTLLFLGDFLG